MYITKKRFDLLYRVYMAAQSVSLKETAKALDHAIEKVQEYEIEMVTEQLMCGETRGIRSTT